MARHETFKKNGLTQEQNSFYISRKRMVEEQLKEIRDKRVLDAMSKVPRHKFVEDAFVDQAYSDHPLNIGMGQTISQPLIVAMMTEALQLKGGEKVLEIGTGSGYQTGILCELAKEVYSIERLDKLSHRARRILYDIGYMNFKLRIGDGTLGWPEAAPFNAVIVTAGSPIVPVKLLEQLADGGRLVIPVGGEDTQILKRFTKEGESFKEEALTGCRFVKLIGEYGWRVE